jgi:hypothetical protein
MKDPFWSNSQCKMSVQAYSRVQNCCLQYALRQNEHSALGQDEHNAPGHNGSSDVLSNAMPKQPKLLSSQAL